MYAKLFSSILDSSLWTADSPTRILFLTMLAMADREGRIFASRSGLQRRAVITDAEFERALSQLSQPDDESSDLTRNPENRGRRIEEAEGGWHVINYQHYRDLQDEDERRHLDKMRQRKHRELSRSVTPRHDRSRSVARSHASEADTEALPSIYPPVSHEGHEEPRKTDDGSPRPWLRPETRSLRREEINKRQARATKPPEPDGTGVAALSPEEILELPGLKKMPGSEKA